LHYELWWENKEVPEQGIVWADAMDPDQPFVLSNGGELLLMPRVFWNCAI
jgi:hypothetical protein